MMHYLHIRQWGLMVAALTLLADVISKHIILDNRFSLPVSIIDGWFALVLAWNRGMSFSMLQDVAWGGFFLGTVAILACAWFIHWLGEKNAWFHQVGLGLIIGGALGNLLDRIVHGAVIDFLLVYHDGWFFPAFNVADSAITVGVICLLMGEFLSTYKLE